MSNSRSLVCWVALAVGCCFAEKPEAAALYQKGKAQFQSGAFVDAVVSLRAAERLGLQSAALHTALGIAYYSIHQYVLFLDQMQKAVQADPSHADAYHYIGRYYEFDVNNYPLALSYFEKALALDSQDVKSLHFRAVCLQMMDRLAEAREGYAAAIRVVEARHERFSWSHQKMAELLLADNIPEALRLARKAVEIDPAVDGNHLILGRVYEAAGNPQGALAEYREAARLKPNDPATRYLLFRLYKKTGETRAAAAELDMHQKLRQIYGSKE